MHIRLIQGLLWAPRASGTDLAAHLQSHYAGARLLWDEVPAPFAFFDNGEPSAGHAFYQLTLLGSYPAPPPEEELIAQAEAASEGLGRDLEGTPPGVGWQLFGDMRPVE